MTERTWTYFDNEDYRGDVTLTLCNGRLFWRVVQDDYGRMSGSSEDEPLERFALGEKTRFSIPKAILDEVLAYAGSARE